MPYYAKKLQEEGFPKGIQHGRSININKPQETVVEDIKHMDGETKKPHDLTHLYKITLFTWECQCDEILDTIQFILLRINLDLDLQDVNIAKLVFELLRATQAQELSLYHDGQPGTERITFLHSSKT